MMPSGSPDQRKCKAMKCALLTSGSFAVDGGYSLTANGM
jgi:hypothetical protein